MSQSNFPVKILIKPWNRGNDCTVQYMHVMDIEAVYMYFLRVHVPAPYMHVYCFKYM